MYRPASSKNCAVNSHADHLDSHVLFIRIFYSQHSEVICFDTAIVLFHRFVFWFGFCLFFFLIPCAYYLLGPLCLKICVCRIFCSENLVSLVALFLPYSVFSFSRISYQMDVGPPGFFLSLLSYVFFICLFCLPDWIMLSLSFILAFYKILRYQVLMSESSFLFFDRSFKIKIAIYSYFMYEKASLTEGIICC